MASGNYDGTVMRGREDGESVTCDPIGYLSRLSSTLAYNYLLSGPGVHLDIMSVIDFPLLPHLVSDTPCRMEKGERHAKRTNHIMWYYYMNCKPRLC